MDKQDRDLLQRLLTAVELLTSDVREVRKDIDGVGLTVWRIGQVIASAAAEAALPNDATMEDRERIRATVIERFHSEWKNLPRPLPTP